MARTSIPARRAARSAADTAADPAPAPVAPATGVSPAAAILAALSAEPGGATVAVIAGQAQVSVAAARQALIAHEKDYAVTRVRGGQPGIPDTWTSAVPAAPRDEAPSAEVSGAVSAVGTVQSSAEPFDATADAGQPDPALSDGTAEGGEPEVSAAPGPDPAVTAEAAGNILAIAQAADEAGKALNAGDLDSALTAMEAARDQAVRGRRVIKAAASGRRVSAARLGALRDLVEEHLRAFPGKAFTPHQVGKVLTRSAGAVANALDKLVSLGVAQMVTDKPRSYRLASAAPDAIGEPGTSAEATASAT